MKIMYTYLMAGLVFCCLTSQTYAANVFINEIHYDNMGADQNEGIEIAGPAAFDLLGWSIYLYNGSTGNVYRNIVLNAILTDLQNGYGTLFTAISPVQNGVDAVALVDPSSVVIQFLSYEGTVAAVGGPADGLISTDIGVSESSSTPVGYSLQLTGAGIRYDDFTWSSSLLSTYNDINRGQLFAAVPEPSSLVMLGSCLVLLAGFCRCN